MEDVHRSTLSNGLVVLIQEAHAAPVATFWVWYRVGSRNESPGLTGISHWVEHMLFKGTPSHPPGTLKRLIQRLGGLWNGFTSNDYTAFFEVLPAEHINVAVRLEADRMINTPFEAAVVDGERTVIISEREGYENFPQHYLTEEVEAIAFKMHPYRQPVIGWKSDLRAITRDDLFAHYRTYYHPGNAIAVAVGDFDAGKIAKTVAETFGAIPAGPRPPAVRTVEPVQEGERRVVVRRPGGTAYVQMAFHTPEAAHPDMPGLLVLDGILSGFKGITFRDWAGSRSSRLYRALVEGGLASEVASFIGANFDPSLFWISATARSGIDPARIEAVVDEQIARLQDAPVGVDELVRVLRQARANVAFGRDGVQRRARALGALAAIDRPQLLDELADQIERVTPDEVTRVAGMYLDHRRRTVGWYVPDGASAVKVAS